MTKLIINADDFGYCDSVNKAIISAHKEGVITSCTIMTGMPGFEEGVKLLQENPTLSCGVHMTLTCYKPVLNTHKTIVDENGYFYRRMSPEILEQIDTEEIYLEFCAQIDKAIAHGIDISHLDSHHHVHTMPMLKDVIKRITDKYKLPIRGGFKEDIDLNVKSIPLVGTFYKDNVCVDFFKKHINVDDYEIFDMMCHPGFVSDFLKESTSYCLERETEYSILTSKEFRKSIEDLNMTLTNYKKL